MLVSDYPMAGMPDARLPWAPAWETLSICCHCVMAGCGNGLATMATDGERCVMAGCGNGLATSRESRRNIMNRLDLKKVNVCVTDQKHFIAAANSGVGVGYMGCMVTASLHVR